MIASAVLYLGLIVSGIGALSVIVPLRFLGVRRRSAGIGLLAAGLVMVVVSVMLPVRTVRMTMLRTELDRLVPTYQFSEVHAVRIEAPRDRVDQAIRRVTADEISLFHALTWIRRLGQPGPESILNAAGRVPLLDVAIRTSFIKLADRPGREIVIGSLMAAPEGWTSPARPTAQDFRSIRRPGFVLAAMNFRIEDAGRGACTVTTETRVYATDDASCRRFAAYWRLIYPGSVLIRHMWLGAIQRRAESPPRDSVRRRHGVDAATMPGLPLPRPGAARA